VPDPNKLQALADAGFKIRACCAICVHANFKPGSDWGACNLIPYKHLKHTAEQKSVSIHKSGYCDGYEADPTKLADLARSGFDRFVG
jgi:hypothetical protein